MSIHLPGYVEQATAIGAKGVATAEKVLAKL